MARKSGFDAVADQQKFWKNFCWSAFESCFFIVIYLATPRGLLFMPICDCRFYHAKQIGFLIFGG